MKKIALFLFLFMTATSVSFAQNKTFTVNGVSFTMVEVKGGTFTMGATREQVSDANEDEKPSHQVTLSPYYIGQTEVTQALWQAVMGSNPSYFTRENGYKTDLQRPVENVSWDDCQAFINRLNSLTGQNFKLPTEAQWEFAARGGNKSRGYKYSGSNEFYDVTNHLVSETVKVGTMRANELGLYDMSGNVWEWCQDWYGDYYYSDSHTDPIGPDTGTRRVYRGGGCCMFLYSPEKTCRVSYRTGGGPGFRDYALGLRLALNTREAIDTRPSRPVIGNKTFTIGDVSFTMVAVQGGVFTMGATSEQEFSALSNEKPKHQVTLSDYYIGKTEVTQELWLAVMGTNPSRFTGFLTRPVENVSWNDCQTFIRKLNSLTGQCFRLPTEAQWEFAARGGNKRRSCMFSGSPMLSDVAWYADNSYNETHDVGTKRANELDIYDMSGNVEEWCFDIYGHYSSVSQTDPHGSQKDDSQERVIRGGSYSDSEERGQCRVSYRTKASPALRSCDIGFRLALSSFKESNHKQEIYTPQQSNSPYVCFYVVGTKKQLKQQKVSDKALLRKNKLEKGDDAMNFFTKVDKRTLNKIALHSKKAKVMSKHPSGSYSIEDAEGQKVLHILDPNKFWNLSNYLVVEIEESH